MTADTQIQDRLADLDEIASRELSRLDEHLEHVDDLLSYLREELPEDGDGAAAEFRELVEAIDEFEDIVRKADPETLAAAIETDEVDAEDVRALLGSEEDLDLRDLLEMLDLEGLWQATDVRDLWKEIREFQDEADDVDFGGDGAEEAADDDGLPGIDTDGVGMDDVPSGMTDDLSEKRIQSTVMDGVEEFRASLVGARARLKDLREENEERMADHRDEVDSRNPTAVSTMPTAGPSQTPAGRYSTVPRETKYSSAPNKRRIYGRRFDELEEELEEDREDA